MNVLTDWLEMVHSDSSDVWYLYSSIKDISNGDGFVVVDDVKTTPSMKNRATISLVCQDSECFPSPSFNNRMIWRGAISSLDVYYDDRIQSYDVRQKFSLDNENVQLLIAKLEMMML